MRQKIRLLSLAALSMAYGWGWRGDYGHELGAMLPGALVAMAICLGSGRRDWWNNVLLFGSFGAIGWAFGGSQSYGIVIGYTFDSRLDGVAYGFGGLFVVGALWGAIGGGLLGLVVSRPRARLRGFIMPMLLVATVWTAFDWNGVTAWSEKWYWLERYDVDWLAALSAFVVAGAFAIARQSNEAKLLALLGLGWWAGFVLLVLGLGLRMTPPRSDNWAGIAGVWIVLWGYLAVNSERAALRSMGYGAVFGGFGFSIGALFMSIGHYFAWQINSWRLMEQTFGLVMGFGTAAAFLKLIDGDLVPQDDDPKPGALDWFGLFVLFPVVLGFNFIRGLNEWINTEGIGPASRVIMLTDEIAGIDAQTWFFGLVVLASIVLAALVLRHRRKPIAIVPADELGRAQLAYLAVLWISVAAAFALKTPQLGIPGQFFSQLSFIVLALACSWLALTIPNTPRVVVDFKPASDRHWRMSYRYWLLWVAVPAVVFCLAWTAVKLHPEPVSGSHYRFEKHGQLGKK